MEEVEIKYTTKDYERAAKAVDNRAILIDDKKYFPIKKDLLVEVSESLIFATIYGEQVMSRFSKELVGLKDLINDLQNYATRNKHILSIDKRRIYCPEARTALNYCLQSSGSIIVKQWMINTDDMLKELNLQVGKDYWQSGYFHDELAFTVKEEYAEQVREILERASEPLQEQFDLKLPFEAEAKIGDSWYDVH
jgi:DNA polymerase I-like protein with 3'-5' exonuclease and polymerase domains